MLRRSGTLSQPSTKLFVEIESSIFVAFGVNLTYSVTISSLVDEFGTRIFEQSKCAKFVFSHLKDLFLKLHIS